MSRKFRVQALLTPAHWREFHELLADHRTTIDSAHRWLIDRGYTVSRTAVGSFVRFTRRGSPLAWRELVGGGTDEEIRSKVAGWVAQLAGPQLLSLAMIAAFMASAGAEPGGREADPAG